MDSHNSLGFSKCGLGLISNDETPRVFNPNVIESSSLVLLNDIKPTSPPPFSSPPPLLPPSSKKKDPGGVGFIDDMGGGVEFSSLGLLKYDIKPMMTPTSPPPPFSSPPPLPPPSSKKKVPGGKGFIDDMGGGVDGLMSCTESLGFESCDERRVDDDDNDDHHHRTVEICEGDRDRWRKKMSEKKRSERNKKFPPPLSSLNQNGQPCFYLKPVRKNGRLELTEVKIQRPPEILRAVRENGRLRLHLVSSHISSNINEEEEQQQDLDFQEEEEKKVEELWKYRVTEEGFRRCQELVMNHHQDHHHINDHHSFYGWRQPCVTTT